MRYSSINVFMCCVRHKSERDRLPGEKAEHHDPDFELLTRRGLFDIPPTSKPKTLDHRTKNSHPAQLNTNNLTSRQSSSYYSTFPPS